MSDFEQQRIFTENLKRIIESKNLTQIEVYEAIGVSQQTFNKWMRGKSIPRMGKIQKLADFFGVSKSALVDEHKTDPLYEPAKESVYQQELIKLFSQLNDEGKEQAIDYIEFLLAKEIYKKSDSIQEAI